MAVSSKSVHSLTLRPILVVFDTVKNPILQSVLHFWVNSPRNFAVSGQDTFNSDPSKFSKHLNSGLIVQLCLDSRSPPM